MGNSADHAGGGKVTVAMEIYIGCPRPGPGSEVTRVRGAGHRHPIRDGPGLRRGPGRAVVAGA